MKSKTYTQNEQPLDITQSFKLCKLGVERIGNDFLIIVALLKTDITEIDSVTRSFCRILCSAYATCTSDPFTYNNKRCIPLRWRCDYDDDCRDGSDERG